MKKYLGNAFIVLLFLFSLLPYYGLVEAQELPQLCNPQSNSMLAGAYAPSRIAHVRQVEVQTFDFKQSREATHRRANRRHRQVFIAKHSRY